MISIVLPSYNGEKYIRQSIDSIITQTYHDWELIIINDCSTDNTGIIAEEYAQKDCRIKVIHNKINKKLPTSLNVGFEEAKGEFFTWTSDDNVYKKNALDRLLSPFLESTDVDLVFSDYTIIDMDDYILFDVKAGPLEDIYFKDVIGASFLYKREVHFGVNGFDSNKFLVEDYDFWLKAKRKYKFYYLNEILYYYRIHRSSLTAKRKQEVEKSTIELLAENIKYIPEKSLNIRKKVEEKIEIYYKTNKKDMRQL
jgi:glycosyltransferase involved in cell wall biosynthesis